MRLLIGVGSDSGELYGDTDSPLALCNRPYPFSFGGNPIMRVGDVLQVKDGGLKGVRVVLLRQSDRTGRWSVRLLDNRGIWKEGDTTLFDPSELEAYSPQDAVINRAAGLADLPMDHLRLLATSGANAHQALQELQGCTRGDLIRKILKGEFIGS